VTLGNGHTVVTMPESPYLSIVVASRNDDHGGNILVRTILFVNGLIAQTNRHKLCAELIVVEWNPPEGRPPLASLLPQPAAGDYLTIRYVTVPPALHAHYRRAKEIPLFQMTAKNVGIRRAKGKFVLCTNIDLLFSDSLFRMLAARSLRHDTVYRANRCDVLNRINPEWPLDEQLAWCEKNVIRRIGMDPRFVNLNMEQLDLNDKAWLKKWIADKLAWVVFRTPERRQFYRIDSFACGDFTLMAHQAWLHIEGYAELDLYSIHIDTLGLIAAASLGYRQHTFPRAACTYHMDHPEGWSSMNPREKIEFLQERPGIDYGLVYETAMVVLKEKDGLRLNLPNWGFADRALEEYVVPS
jgi:hypothetical protein